MPIIESEQSTEPRAIGGLTEVPRLTKPISCQCDAFKARRECEHAMTDAELQAYVDQLRGSRSMSPKGEKGPRAPRAKKEPEWGKTTW